MAQFGGQTQTQVPPTGWCDYCHQKPKFSPYDYCSKACGSRAKATGSNPSNGPVMCKQCGQKPVYKGHQFCGRKCANVSQAPINTGQNGQPQHGQQWWNQMPPPYMQNPPSNQIYPPQGSNQGSALIGIVRGLSGLVSRGQQPQPPQPPQPPQQQPGQSNPPHMQQALGPISPGPMILMISPPITPMSSGMDSPMSPGIGGPMSPGTFDPMSPGTPTPTSPGLNQQYYTPSSPTSPGIQDPNTNNYTNGQNLSPPPFPALHIPKQDTTPGQESKTVNKATNPGMNPACGDTKSSHEPNSDPHDDSDEDSMGETPSQYSNSNQFPGQGQGTGGYFPAQAQAQAQFSVHVTSPPTGAGGHGNGNWGPGNVNNFRSQPFTSTSSSPSTTCRLKGCNKPVFVDPVTHLESEYCSHRHREDATTFGQVDPCIMCLKMPRGPVDHFCSRMCRDKALSP